MDGELTVGRFHLTQFSLSMAGQILQSDARVVLFDMVFQGAGTLEEPLNRISLGDHDWMVESTYSTKFTVISSEATVDFA
jgi:hypothetical protein